MIKASHVTKKFGSVVAVDDLSFELDKAESIALWGSNGAGKTTLIRSLLGIFPSTGTISIHGVDVRKHGKQARSFVGYVPQELAFHDDAKLGSSIMFFANLRRVDRKGAAVALAKVGLQGHEKKRLRDLSGGMKQRLALAIALIADPPIIVLDEPTSNLDASGRCEVIDTLCQLRDDGKTLLFASHRPDEVLSLAGRVLVMEKGKLIKDITPSELWPTESRIQTMRLYLSMGTEETAAAVLRDAGHAVNLNGNGLCVSVPRNRKAEPVSVLAKAEIEVRDFEILEEVQGDHA
ncbi:MAG: ABC transporter ATP-binding protein [Phycisphaerales bacterium]|nr:ABC transporter ATP-binding protein [Phycisphaerales bacterium]